MNFKKVLAAVGIATLGSVVAFGGTAFASGINGTGNVTCNTITGKVSFKPGLKLSTPQTVTTTIKTTAKNCTVSGGNVTSITSISTKSSTVTMNDTCANLQTPATSTITSKYKATPKLNSSMANLTTTPGMTGFTFAGTGTSGSFA